MNKKKSTFIKVITPLLTTGICFGAFYLGACAAPADSSPAGNAVPASLSKQSQTSGPGSLTELSAAVNTPSSSKKPASYTDAEAPDGFTLLKTETASLDSVRNLKLLLSFEDVTLYPTADNTVTMLFYGNNRITYAKDEIASLRQTSGSVSLESGKMNKAWSRLSSDKWQPKVYIYLPADFAGNLQVQIGSCRAPQTCRQLPLPSKPPQGKWFSGMSVRTVSWPLPIIPDPQAPAAFPGNNVCWTTPAASLPPESSHL